MKNILYVIILFFLMNNLFANDFDVVAKVNDRIITNYDLENYINVFQSYFKNVQNVDSVNFKKEVLNEIVDNILKKEAIINEKIAFDKEEFKYFLDSFEEKNKIDKYNSNKKLYLDMVKTNFLWLKLIDQKIRPTIIVNNSEVNDSLEYLANNPIRTRYNISQIIIYERKKSDSYIIVNKIYEEIKSNNNFENIAEKLSQDKISRKNKGYIGWVDEIEMNEKIYKAIRNLSINDITEPLYFPVNNGLGYYLIIKLNDKKQEKIAKQDDISRAQYFIYGQKLNLAIKSYLDNLYNNSFIESYI